MRILVDAMGGDLAPDEIVKGAVHAQRELGAEIVLVGQRAAIETCLRNEQAELEIIDASEVITMDDDPSTATRRKKDASMTVALNLLRDGKGDAVVSAGSTGALLTGATLIVKRIHGIRRAALAPVLPNGDAGVMLIDCGANADCTPEYLLQFAYMGSYYARSGADELVYLDISATREERGTFTRLVERIADEINIPFTVGGGIGSVEDASRLLDAGADKISINSAAIASPSLIDSIASRYGNQFVVVAIDARMMEDGTWRATTHGGTRPTDKELFSWAHEAQERGAGEILFTSMNHDGTRSGYPCETFARLADMLSIPVIASGGAGSVADIADVLTKGRADAALAASIFHYGEITIGDLKRQLKQMNINVRI